MGLILQIEADASGLRRVLGQARGESRAVAAAIGGDFRKAGDEVTRAFRRMRSEAGRALALVKSEEQRLTDEVRKQSERRRKLVEAEGKARERYTQRGLESSKKAEEQLTEAAVQGSRKRVQALTEEFRQRDRIARNYRSPGGGPGRGRSPGAGRGREQGGRAFDAVTGYAGHIGGAIANEREQAALLETGLNSAFIQTGAGFEETARLRQRVMQVIRDRRLNAGVTVGALDEAQSFANALGGDTQEQRAAAVEDTLRDVQFASAINPTNVSGLVRFGALMRRQVSDRGLRSQIMRASAGISFEGSVETDAALRSGLPGMMQAISANTANVAPRDRERVIQETVTDFLAQIQTVAASGGSVGVTANRIGTLRTALSNPYRQQRLGEALAARERTMTAEQRTEFHQAFQRDGRGRYTLNSEIANSPSRAGRLFGHLFNNDAVAMRSFLGTHGGGGAQQLLTRPVQDLIASYFSTTTNSRGQVVRQYDAVEDLRRSALSPERMQEIERIRDSEDSKNLIDMENARRAALTDNTNALVRLANALQTAGAEHPLLAPALGAGGGAAGRELAGRAGGLLGLGGEGAAGGGVAAGVGGVSLGLIGGGLAAAAGLAVTAHEAGRANRQGATYTDIFMGREGQFGSRGDAADYGDALTRGREASRQTEHAELARSLFGSGSALSEAVASGVARGIQQSGGVPVRQDPLDRAEAGARGASGSPPPAP